MLGRGTAAEHRRVEHTPRPNTDTGRRTTPPTDTQIHAERASGGHAEVIRGGERPSTGTAQAEQVGAIDSKGALDKGCPTFKHSSDPMQPI
jgi:hypothetical protein